MELYIFSDESGVFDRKSGRYYVFGGIVLLSKDSKDKMSRQYLHAERVVREKNNIPLSDEVKASILSPLDRRKLFGRLNDVQKFGAVIELKRVLERIWKSKKDKQRFLDWAYKMAAKNLFMHLIRTEQINPSEITGLNFFIDEHNTATNGYYELRESLEQEFKRGMYSFDWRRWCPPIFPNLLHVRLTFCNSAKITLIRAADIVANRLFWETNNNPHNVGMSDSKMFVTRLP